MDNGKKKGRDKKYQNKWGQIKGVIRIEENRKKDSTGYPEYMPMVFFLGEQLITTGNVISLCSSTFQSLTVTFKLWSSNNAERCS